MMHGWHRWEFPLQYGFGTMYFALPRPFAPFTGLRPMWGHSGTTGSFLYYAVDADLFLAATVDQIESKLKPFTLMRRIINALKCH
jgi:hypothetical protein